MSRLTKEEVLQAVNAAISPDSIYIGDMVQRRHAEKVRAGFVGHSPRVDLILFRLRQLEADGLLTRSPTPNGYYGYRWAFTDAGRAALAPEPSP